MSAGAVTSLTAMALYQRIVGDSWRELDAPVRLLHSTGALMRGAGSFNVRRGNRRAARLLASLFRLPETGENVSTRVVVTPCRDGERWHRTFAGKSFVTKQRAHAGPFLAERIGMIEILFRLEVKNGALFYQQTMAVLDLGPWRMPLPGWLAPRVVASEQVAAGATRVQVSVSVDAPVVGLLVAYSGTIEREDEGA